jgi:sn-glycerol 3-phosphate transport system substrate-binding protein
VTRKGGEHVSGGSLYIVKQPSAARQAAAWQFAKYLNDPETQATWAVGTGYVPIRESAADSKVMTDYWAANPEFKVAYDQLLNGPTNSATAGSVIGNYLEVRDAVRDGENSMFLEGTAPNAALKSAASTATNEIDDYNVRVGVT